MPPLHHLIKNSQATALLSEFRELSPGSSLALLRANGELFASSGELPISPPLAGTELSGPGYHPILAGGEIVAYLSANTQATPILPPLLHSLSFLLQQALEKREVARETLDRYREINLLYNTAETIGACLDPDEIPPLVLTESSRAISADAGLVLLRSQQGAGELEIVARYSTLDDPSPAGDPDHLSPIINDLLDAGRDLVEQVIDTGRPDIISISAYGSILGAPLKARERVFGVVLLGRIASGLGETSLITGTALTFTAGDEKLLMALAGQAGISIEKAWMHQQELQRQRLEQELAIGRRIQRSLLPEKVPNIPGWEFAAYYQSAQEVGGDFYDFFETQPNSRLKNPEQESHISIDQKDERFSTPGNRSLGLFIADVTGKGVPAALMMAFSRAMLRTLLHAGSQFTHHPATTLQRLNDLILRDSRTGLLLTALYAFLEPSSGHLVYANAGHERPIWLQHANGECQELVSRGTLLGAFEQVVIHEYHVNLNVGDLVIFYTDGVTEARNPDGELFGEERLLETIKACRGMSAQEAMQFLLRTVQSFSARANQADDYTTVVIKRVL